jgi:hypothetical protein
MAARRNLQMGGKKIATRNTKNAKNDISEKVCAAAGLSRRHWRCNLSLAN